MSKRNDDLETLTVAGLLELEFSRLSDAGFRLDDEILTVLKNRAKGLDNRAKKAAAKKAE